MHLFLKPRAAIWPLLLGLPLAGLAQATVTTPTEDETVTLSPFVVTSNAENGYLAASTLAGTRLNSPLSDLGAPISAYTKDFLKDIGANNVSDLFVYALSTEGAGLGGNYSATASVDQFNSQDDSRRNPQASNRVRGLVAADVTRDFFISQIPMDSYNVDRVDVSRGPNAILFGLGSPSGVINSYLIKPKLNRDEATVELQYGDNDSYRSVLDINKVLIPKKAALRFALLNEEKHWEQDPTFERTNRIFGAIKFTPFANTTITAHYEGGDIKSRRPLTISPEDGGLSTWFIAGKPTWDGSISTNAPTSQVNPTFPASGATALYNTPSTIFANPGIFWQWAVPIDYNSQTPNTAGFQARRPAAAVSGGPTQNLEFMGTRSLSDFSDTLARQGIPLSVFDYRHQLLSGETGYGKQKFNVGNVTLEQHFLNHQVGIELAYSKERYKEYFNEPFGKERVNKFSIDVNTFLPDGRVNPNFGRPFVKSWESGVRTQDDTIESIRATAYARFDAEQHFKGGFARWLGRHTLTGFFSKQTTDADLRVTKQGWSGGSGTAGFDLNETNIINQRRNVVAAVYVGPSLAQYTSLDQVHLDFNMTAHLPQPGDTYAITYWDRAAFAWKTANFTTVEGIASATLRHQPVESKAAILQSYWLKDSLVTVAGWRRDESNSYIVNNSTANQFTSGNLQGSVDMNSMKLPAAPTFSNKGEIWTYSAVGKLPRGVKRPFGIEPSIHYSQSENFQPAAGGLNIFGVNLAPPTGETKEYGFALSSANNRASLRFNWYETSLTNARSPSANSGLFAQVMNIDFQTAQFWYEGIAAGATSVTQADIDRLINTIPQSAKDLWAYTVITNPDGSKQPQYGNPTSLMADVTNQRGKGLEIEGAFLPTPNWRIAINVAKTQTITSESVPFLADYIALRLPIWTELGSRPRTPGPGEVPGSFLTEVNRLAVAPVASIRNRDGTYSAELRKWRFNFINNYTFPTASRFKGFAVGGAYRWQDKAAIDYPLVNNGSGIFVADVSKPFYAPSTSAIDLWISYRRSLFSNKVKWKLQLNVANAFADDDLIPVTVNTDGTPSMQRVPPPRTWFLTSTFSM